MDSHDGTLKRLEVYIYIYILYIYMGVSKNRGKTPQNGWFIMENPIKMDDLGVPFLEASIYIIQLCHGLVNVPFLMDLS